MPMNHRLMRPKRRRSSAPPPVEAEPSLTVTVQGADPVEEVPGAFETFTISNGGEGAVFFNNGIVFGDVTFNDTGIITIEGPIEGFTITGGGVGNSFITFTADTQGEVDDFSIGEGGASADLTIDVQGANADPGSPGAAEEIEVSFDGATGGTITFQILSIGATDPLPFDVTAEDFETALESATGLGWTVTGADGEFTVTAEEAGVRDDLEIAAHDLTKPAS
jgi:hypothetical protein